MPSAETIPELCPTTRRSSTGLSWASDPEGSVLWTKLRSVEADLPGPHVQLTMAGLLGARHSPWTRGPRNPQQSADPGPSRGAPAPRAAPRRGSGSSRALDGSVKTINSLISLGDMFGPESGDSRREEGGEGAGRRGEARDASGPAGPRTPAEADDADEMSEEEALRGRWIRVRTFSKCSCTVTDRPSVPGSPHHPGRPLVDYLMLPIEDYNLLEPSWIRRAGHWQDADDAARPGAVAQPGQAPSGGGVSRTAPAPSDAPPSEGLLNAIRALGPHARDAFVLSVPVDDLTGLPVRPRMLVRVDPEPSASRVCFESLYMELGNKDLDGALHFAMRATLFRRGQRAARRRLQALLRRGRRGPEAEVGAEVGGEVGGEGEEDSSEGEGAEGGESAGESVAEAGAGLRQGPAGDVVVAHGTLGEARAGRGGEERSGWRRIAPWAWVRRARGAGAAESPQRGQAWGGEVGRGAVEEKSVTAGDEAADGGRGAQAGSASDASAPASPSSLLPPTKAHAAPRAGADAGRDSAAVLGSRLSIELELFVPHPYSRVPGLVLSAAIRVVLEAVVGQLYPRFLDLLARDYAAWATGGVRDMPGMPRAQVAREAARRTGGGEGAAEGEG